MNDFDTFYPSIFLHQFIELFIDWLIHLISFILSFHDLTNSHFIISWSYQLNLFTKLRGQPDCHTGTLPLLIKTWLQWKLYILWTTYYNSIIMRIPEQIRFTFYLWNCKFSRNFSSVSLKSSPRNCSWKEELFLKIFSGKKLVFFTVKHLW